MNKKDMAYLDMSRSFEERAADLVSRMTLEEKVSQIGHKAAAIPRLGVSEYNYWREGLHGVARQGKATSFPSPLSMSNTWNRSLVYRMADIISTEARGKNPKTDLSYWSPTINLARDPRWGRNEETYGEDPYLTGQMGIAFVKGMQGNDKKYLKTIATLKHFAANNNEKNRRGGTSIMSEFNFRNYYTKVFRNVTEEVMPASVMSSYNATSIYRNGELLYNYKPSAANPYLLTDLLRRNWGFDGYVTSDCGAGEDLVTVDAYKKGVLASEEIPDAQMVAQAFLAGMDVECFLHGNCASTANGVDAVKDGYMSEEYLETVVYHLMLQRFRTGEFDEGVKYSDITADTLETHEHIAVAEEAAEEAWVLLKNKNNILPLGHDVKNVVIVGDYAGEVVLGDYSGEPEHIVTPYEGLKAELARTKPQASLEYLGSVLYNAEIFKLKSITLVLSDGSRRRTELSKAEKISGMKLENDMFAGVTPKGRAVIRNVDLTSVTSIEAEMSADKSSLGGTVEFRYGSANGPCVASITGQATDGVYKTFTGEYTGSDGGYGGIADLYISVSPTVKKFSVENFKEQLDAADVIIAYAGTTLADSRESYDRESIALPPHQSHVTAITKAYPDKTVVAIQSVGEIDTAPFEKNSSAIMWTSYNGQTQGTAFGKIITGQANPSGKLTTTWYTQEDIAGMELAAAELQTVDGIEGYYTNYDLQGSGANQGHTYQYYKGKPLYPFGYGLSYTSFEYSDIRIDKTHADANGSVTISVDIKNTGNITGKEIVQLYISHPQNGDNNIPLKQLVDFEKTELLPNEVKKIQFTVDISKLSLFSERNQKLYVPCGEYTASIGKHANDCSLTKKFNVTGVLASELKTVKAMPDGISLKGAVYEDGVKAVTAIRSNLSAIMTDEVWVDLKAADVSYSCSDADIAVVDDSGIVTSGSKEGVAVITASVTVDGVTKTSSYPVVNRLTDKPSEHSAKDSFDTEIQRIKWGNYNAALTRNEATGETRVWRIISEDIRIQLSTDYFCENDTDYNYGDELVINCITEHDDTLYAGCNNGFVIVFTNCIKCYKLKKVCDFDIKTLHIRNNVMYADGDENKLETDMNDIN